MDKILISACLLGANVRYDGRHNLIEHPALQHWKQQGRLVMVCPESLGGLPTPRPPAEVQSRFPIFVSTRDGEDVTDQFLSGAEAVVKIAKQHNVCCAIMKSHSPSCGNTFTYDGSFSGELTEAPGVAAAELIRHGIPVFNEHQIDQLIRFVEAQTEAA